MLTPADPGYQVAQLVARIGELEARLSRLERTRPVTMQAATVTSYIGGSTTCTVQFTGTGTTKPGVKFLGGWTPAAGDKCTFVDSPSWQGVFPVSIP